MLLTVLPSKSMARTSENTQFEYLPGSPVPTSLESKDLAKLVAEFQEPILQTGSSSTEQKLILNFALNELLEETLAFNEKLRDFRKSRLPFVERLTDTIHYNHGCKVYSRFTWPPTHLLQKRNKFGYYICLNGYKKRCWRGLPVLPGSLKKMLNSETKLKAKGSSCADSNFLSPDKTVSLFVESVNGPSSEELKIASRSRKAASATDASLDIDPLPELTKLKERVVRAKSTKLPCDSNVERLVARISKQPKELLEELPPLDRVKPYCCELCFKRYRNPNGLEYHYRHHHGESSLELRSPSLVNPQRELLLAARYYEGAADSRASITHVAPSHSRVSSVCDFCQRSDDWKNAITCSSCGHYGHFKCLGFTPLQIKNTRTYPWQCMECRVCLVCQKNTSEETLLFCDNCDRAFHMECLNPPLSAAPEGDWICPVCPRS
ncbi:zinc finger protein ubi-d4-like isoform X2 [Zophobas morio]|uniref:zinc finger protein ubi-d4-like isoform X2 n=1 Tax=Zophobas morio TaxID=2755281 RepID=UPI0030834478